MYTLDAIPHTLHFRKPARTSRGEYLEKTAWVLVLRHSNGEFGIGEASPLSDLSPDGKLDFEAITRQLGSFSEPGLYELLERWEPGQPEAMPALRFALHCAMRHLRSTDHSLGYGIKHSIHINGLVWMNELPAMREEALAKIQAGFSCLKLKIGAHDFDAECRLLEELRGQHNAFKLELRVDANGAFNAYDAKEKLRELSRFEIHSIEQPVAAGQGELMAELCSVSPIDIALDEELIGLHPLKDATYIRNIGARYLILKPTLLGGLDLADEWVRLARNEKMDWWATSALEGNIALSAIAQWAGAQRPLLPQGLGTGSLFTRNFPSQVTLKGPELFFDPSIPVKTRPVDQ